MSPAKKLSVLVFGLVLVGVTFGAPTRIMTFESFLGESPDADGMAILNYKTQNDSMIGQIILSDLIANTQYTVLLREPGTWCLDETTATFPIAVFDPQPSGAFFFPISAHNEPTGPSGHLTLHATTTAGTGDFTDSDVIVVLQNEWDNPVNAGGGGAELRVRVRLIGTSGTVFACSGN